MLRAERFFAARPRWIGFAAGAALLALVTVGDVLTGLELAFSTFYLAPVALVAWVVGPAAGTLTAAATALVGTAAQIAAGELRAPSVAVWNGLIRGAMFLVVASLLSTIREGTRIRVEVRRSDGPEGVLLAVEDEGPGVPDHLKATVFEPFRRGAGRSPGAGIGLSLVARFAELHGGRAWVEDRPGGGARFLVLLPGPVVAREGSAGSLPGEEGLERPRAAAG